VNLGHKNRKLCKEEGGERKLMCQPFSFVDFLRIFGKRICGGFSSDGGKFGRFMWQREGTEVGIDMTMSFSKVFKMRGSWSSS